MDRLKAELKQERTAHTQLKCRVGLVAKSITAWGLPKRLNEWREAMSAENPAPSPQTEELLAALLNRLFYGSFFFIVMSVGTLFAVVSQAYLLSRQADILASQTKLLTRQVLSTQEASLSLHISRSAKGVLRIFIENTGNFDLKELTLINLAFSIPPIEDHVQLMPIRIHSDDSKFHVETYNLGSRSIRLGSLFVEQPMETLTPFQGPVPIGQLKIEYDASKLNADDLCGLALHTIFRYSDGISADAIIPADAKFARAFPERCVSHLQSEPNAVEMENG